MLGEAGEWGDAVVRRVEEDVVAELTRGKVSV